MPTSSARNTLVEGATWLALAVAIAGGVKLYFSPHPVIRETPLPVHIEQRANLPIAHDGRIITHAHLNHRKTRLQVDSGATHISLTYADATSAGLTIGHDDWREPVVTANGITHAARARLATLSVGSIVVRDVSVLVHPPETLPISLLGMSFLGRLKRVQMQHGTLVLEN